MAIELTENAVKEVKKLLDKQNEPGLLLRVGVRGGGCAGLTYQLAFEARPGENDKVFEKDGVKIVVDNRSFLYLNGMTVDYNVGGDLMQGGFQFLNPNAKGSCGCGTSFTV